MKDSVQYKQIAEKWNLSPEHPGINVSPTLRKLEYTPYNFLGNGSVLSHSFHQWGPRFFNKPLNEGCFEKGLALMKYAAMFGECLTNVVIGNLALIDSIADYKIAYSKEVKPFKYGEIGKRFVKKYPFPAALGFGYGVCICTSATIRNRDDIYNPLYAAAFSGLLTATLSKFYFFLNSINDV
jgi:hypothetical protein